MIHLRAIERKRPSRPVADDVFPFSVPAVRSLDALDLSSEITFFVGENGSGKSTVLECIAAAASLPTVGSAEIASDASLTGQRDLARLYGEDLDANSHGESFLRLFQARVIPGGLDLLDEPEAALSPQSQLGLLALLRDRVGDDCQFVVATHSPILLAVPGARARAAIAREERRVLRAARGRRPAWDPPGWPVRCLAETQ